MALFIDKFDPYILHSEFTLSHAFLRRLDPRKTAIIVIDMWNYHWCITTTERVAALVPRMNAVLKVARLLGMHVIWNPSDVVEWYSGEASREQAVSVRRIPVPTVNESREMSFTARIGNCMCGPGIACVTNYGWKKMARDLIIEKEDFISVDLTEIYSIVTARNVTDLIYMGVAANMCVYHRPGGIKSMCGLGFQCWLARDLNDAMTRYEPEANYTPDDGTTETDNNYVEVGIRNINLGQEFMRDGRLSAKPMDFMRFVPWGKLSRPYFFVNDVTVTLTAIWMEGSDIHYTTDGTEPTVESPKYSRPLNVNQTLTVRAAAFVLQDRVSLLSDAYYVKVPPQPPKPTTYLDDLPFRNDLNVRRFAGEISVPKRKQSYVKTTLRIRGQNYSHGLGFPAHSIFSFPLRPEYLRFVGLAGVDDEVASYGYGMFMASDSAIIFRVFIDGQMFAESPVMRLLQVPWPFDVKIPPNARVLTLAVVEVGTGRQSSYGNWVDAGFVEVRKMVVFEKL
jgi:nicotinamidase-related amidase